MKKIFLILFLCCVLSVPSFASGFMSAFEEIPLQDGLEEKDVLSFDTEEIRIIEQYVSSMTLSRAEFVKFYKETLKSLGWELKSERDDTYSFKREDENLSFTIESDVPLVVVFSLKPYGK